MDDIGYLKAEAARCLGLAANTANPAIAQKLCDYGREFKRLAAAVARDDARESADAATLSVAGRGS
jgi:hypothetical protein